MAIVTSEPLAGTRALSGSAGEDAYNRAELQSDSREIVEHIISVKAAIGELETLCVRDSVAVTDLMSVRKGECATSGVSGMRQTCIGARCLGCF